MANSITFGTRPSALARWQTEYVINRIKAAFPGISCNVKVIVTKGDRILDRPLPEIGGKGLFTLELEEKLRANEIDAAVHSLKDLPTEDAAALIVGVIPERADPRDVWICPTGHKLQTIHRGAKVGTSSNRRRAQLLARRPDLEIQPIRGNIDTRLKKTFAGQYDAIVLAAAGLQRLGFEDQITNYFSFDEMLPAPGQGALGVQCRANDQTTLQVLKVMEDMPTRAVVLAERAFLEGLGGGCSLPVGAFAEIRNGAVHLRGVVASPTGDRLIEVSEHGKDAIQVGKSLAGKALANGAGALLEAAL